MALPRSAAQCTLLMSFCFATASQGADLILNEANAVGPAKWLANPDQPSCECPPGETCATADDVHFGRIMGNGGDWIELVVTADHLDIRGWELRWAETDNTPGNADNASGTDIWYGLGTVEQGVITFTNDPVWSDLRAGTVLTLIERTTAQGGLDTDFSFNPCAGDLWINVNCNDTQYITTVHNVLDDPDEPCIAGELPGCFNVGNDAWELTILDDQDAVILGPIGEAHGGSGWQGSGINSRETIRLSENPSPAVNNFSAYEDSDQSSFGHPNRWSDNNSNPPPPECPRSQDFRTLRSWISCPCARVVLNEYNAVGETIFLNGGNAQADDSGGQAADLHFGRVAGNGFDWFELVVADDHVDMRNWTLNWEEVTDGESGTITLSNSSLWQNLRAGTVITFTRFNTAEGGLDTNLSYNFNVGDRWINIWTGDASAIASTTSTVSGHGFGDFHASNDKWRLTIRDAANAVVGMSAGEGASGYAGRGIGNTDVAALQEAPSSATRSWSLYTESIMSTFGAANAWKTCPGNVTVTQNLSTLFNTLCTEQPDTDANGVVNVDDLFNVIGGWGPCPGLPNPCLGDVNNDGQTNIDDLFDVIAAWS